MKCKWCHTPMVSANAVGPWYVWEGHTIPATVLTTISACPTCDRPRCPNAGCGMPTGPLLPLGQRDLTPTTCEHCKLPIQYKGVPS